MKRNRRINEKPTLTERAWLAVKATAAFAGCCCCVLVFLEIALWWSR